MLFSLDALPAGFGANDQRHPLDDPGGVLQPVPLDFGTGEAANRIFAAQYEVVKSAQIGFVGDDLIDYAEFESAYRRGGIDGILLMLQRQLSLSCSSCTIWRR